MSLDIVGWFLGFMVQLPVIPSLVLLILSGLVLETKFAGRMVILANAILLWQIFVPTWSALDANLQAYLAISIVFALVSFVALMSDVLPMLSHIKLITPFYELGYGLYSSKTVLGLWMGSWIGWGLIVSCLMAIAVWALAVRYLGHRIPFM